MSSKQSTTNGSIIKMGPRYGELKQLRSTYIERELADLNEEFKRPQRERVTDFFVEHLNHNRDHRPYNRCFTLPGAHWRFEQLLERRFGQEIGFLAVERNYTILERGLPWMPGKSRLYDEEETYWRKFRSYSSTRSRVFWCKASEFMNVPREYKKDKKQLQRWWNQYKRWTAAWLDFSAPINDEMITCCKRLEAHLDPQTKHIPVAVTFMIGREDAETFRIVKALSRERGGADDRGQFILAMWEGNKHWKAELQDVWSYQSAGGCPMGVLTALFSPK
jgi:hypothetical protein